MVAICMDSEDALRLVEQLAVRGIRLRQRGRLIHVSGGSITQPLTALIAHNWALVARAAGAYRQGEVAIARVRRVAALMPVRGIPNQLKNRQE